MVRKRNLAIFESSNTSETGDATPTKIGVHACYINAYLHKFFEPIPIDSIFLMTMDYMVRNGSLAVFESSSISKTGDATPTKIGLHAFNVNLYLHEFFEPILFFDPHGLYYSPWSEGKIWPF